LNLLLLGASTSRSCIGPRSKFLIQYQSLSAVIKVSKVRSKLLGPRKWCIVLLLLLLPGQLRSSANEEEDQLGVQESFCQGLKSWIISGKLLKEELLTGFSPREGFSPGCVPISGVRWFTCYCFYNYLMN